VVAAPQIREQTPVTSLVGRARGHVQVSASALALAAALLVVAATPASAHHGSYERDCGDQSPPSEMSPYTDLEADNVSCGAARKLADKYSSGEFSDGYKGWACNAKVLSVEDLKVKCQRDKNGGQRAKFLVGS
jgi:hypothetical protein